MKKQSKQFFGKPTTKKSINIPKNSKQNRYNPFVKQHVTNKIHRTIYVKKIRKKKSLSDFKKF